MTILSVEILSRRIRNNSSEPGLGNLATRDGSPGKWQNLSSGIETAIPETSIEKYREV
jgi:hypothetical protein